MASRQISSPELTTARCRVTPSLRSPIRTRSPCFLTCSASSRPSATRVRRWATDLGLAFTFQAAANLARIETALVGLYDISDRLIAARRVRPGDDLVARAELEEALPRLAAAIRDLRITGPVRWRPPTGISGPAELPLGFRRR